MSMRATKIITKPGIFFDEMYNSFFYLENLAKLSTAGYVRYYYDYIDLRHET